MALTKTPIELSSTPSIVDGGNATAITIGSDESVALGGTLSLPNANATNEISFTGTEFTNVLSATTSGFQLGTTGAGYLAFLTNNAEAFRLTAARDMYFGQTTGSDASVGHIMQANGVLFSTAAGSAPLRLRRNTSNGNIVELKKDSAAVGSLGVHGTRLTIGSSSASGLRFDGANLIPMSSGSLSDGTVDVGYSSNRFKDLYLSGGAYLGGTGAANKLEDYEEGTWTMTLDTNIGNATITSGNTTGNYTKVGNLVTLNIYNAGSNVSAAGSGAPRIGGFPFPVASGSGSYACASFAHTDIFSTTYSAYGAVGNTFAQVTQVGSIANASFGTGNPKYLMFSITYMTTA